MKNHYEIDGWFNYPKSFDFLLSTIPDGGTFVECGAWFGSSSSYLCDKAKERIKVFIIDTWEGSETESAHKIAKTTDIFKVFLENMGNRKFTPIRKKSIEASKDFKNESCDVVYIDMDHRYEFVKKDIECWLPKVKNNGYIAGHDYTPNVWDGVVKAVNQIFGKQNIKIMDGNSWIVKKNMRKLL